MTEKEECELCMLAEGALLGSGMLSLGCWVSDNSSNKTLRNYKDRGKPNFENCIHLISLKLQNSYLADNTICV